MMILTLRFRRANEADHAMRIKGRCSSAQGTFCQIGLLRSFGRRDPVQDDGAKSRLGNTSTHNVNNE